MKEEAREKTSKFQACYHATYTRVFQGSRARVCLYRAPNTREKHSNDMRVPCVTHDSTEVTWRALARSTGSDRRIDRQTPAVHYVRERNAPASIGSLTATLTYYRSLTIGNRRRAVRTIPLTLRDPLDANGTRVIRAFLLDNVERY